MSTKPKTQQASVTYPLLIIFSLEKSSKLFQNCQNIKYFILELQYSKLETTVTSHPSNPQNKVTSTTTTTIKRNETKSYGTKTQGNNKQDKAFENELGDDAKQHRDEMYKKMTQRLSFMDNQKLQFLDKFNLTNTDQIMKEIESFKQNIGATQNDDNKSQSSKQSEEEKVVVEKEEEKTVPDDIKENEKQQIKQQPKQSKQQPKQQMKQQPKQQAKQSAKFAKNESKTVTTNITSTGTGNQKQTTIQTQTQTRSTGSKSPNVYQSLKESPSHTVTTTSIKKYDNKVANNKAQKPLQKTTTTTTTSQSNTGVAKTSGVTFFSPNKFSTKTTRSSVPVNAKSSNRSKSIGK